MNSPEFEILLQSVRLDDQEKALERAFDIIRKNAINWNELYDTADLHQIKPLLAKLINKLPSHSVPEDFRERINTAYRENLYQQLRNTAEFIRIKDELSAENIEAIPYKGFWLAHEFYGSLADRESVDIDLYVRFNDLDRIIKIMPLLGYRAETSSSQAFLKKIKKVSAEYNFDKFEGQERIHHVEFHWQTGSSMHGLDISLDDLSPQIISGKFQNREFPVFSHSANLILAIMHHGGKDAFLQLKQVSDIGMIIKNGNNINWGWVLDSASRFNMLKLVYLAVTLASEITGVIIPEALRPRADSKNIRQLADDRLMRMSEQSEKLVKIIYGSDDLCFHLRTRSGWKIKSRFIISKCRSAVVGFLTPKKLLDFYLRKRYDISRKGEI